MKTTIKTLMGAIITALIVVGCATTQLWDSWWEVRSRTTHEPIGQSVLDQYGKSGWELVTCIRIPVVHTDTNHVATTNMDYEYTFKRPKK